MPNNLEICYVCGNDTDRFLYIGSDGPFCEECYDFYRLQKEKEDSLITIDKEILIDSLCDKFKNIPYEGKLFYNTKTKRIFCKIHLNLEGRLYTIQKDSYTQAIEAVEKEINDYLHLAVIEKTSKRFLTIPVVETEYDNWGIEEYYQDLENFEELIWISADDSDVVMQVIIPGVWSFDNRFYIAIETELEESSIRNEIDKIMMNSLSSLQKIITKKIRTLEKSQK
jgi:hypothetical protein